MIIIFKVLSVVAFICSIFWMIANPGYEPGLAIIASLSTFISTFVIEKHKKREAIQRQSVSDNSVGIQAGGDVNISNLNNQFGKNDDAK